MNQGFEAYIKLSTICSLDLIKETTSKEVLLSGMVFMGVETSLSRNGSFKKPLVGMGSPGSLWRRDLSRSQRVMSGAVG